MKFNCIFRKIIPKLLFCSHLACASDDSPVLGSKITQISKYRPKKIKVEFDINPYFPRT